MSSLLFQGGRVIDPVDGLDAVTNLLVVDGHIVERTDAVPAVDRVIDASGKIVAPGLIDLHVALRDPGYEEDENTASGTAAALAGGFTLIAALPDTVPVVDNRASAEFVILQAERAANCRVLPLGAVTKDHLGEELADLGQLVDGGAVGFTDAKQALRSAEVLRRALEYSRMFDKPIFTFPQDPTLTAGGVMHEGFYSTVLGLRGMPAAAEEIMVGRDIALAELTGGRVHLMTISTRHSVDEVRRAKKLGIAVTADISPQHLVLTDECLQSYDANFKQNPPLRTRDHIDALIEGLRDGTIDAISSDHQPYAGEKKVRELDQVPFGSVGLETTVGVLSTYLAVPGIIDWLTLIKVLTIGPARILNIPSGTLRPGAAADIVLIDPNQSWTVDPAEFHSRSRNTPFTGHPLTGKVAATFVAGQMRYDGRRVGQFL